LSCHLGSDIGTFESLLRWHCDEWSHLFIAQDPKEEEASSGSPVSSLKTAASLKDRLAEALREIERLRAALEEANQQQEWVLGNVVKNSEAEKEELSRALQ
jgi:hypothetical protein